MVGRSLALNVYIFFGNSSFQSKYWVDLQSTSFYVIQPQNITLIGCLIVESIHWGLHYSYWYLLPKQFPAWLFTLNVDSSEKISHFQSFTVQLACSLAHRNQFFAAFRLVEASFLLCSHIDHGSAIFTLSGMSKLLFWLILTILLLTQDLFCGDPLCWSWWERRHLWVVLFLVVHFKADLLHCQSP